MDQSAYVNVEPKFQAFDSNNKPSNYTTYFYVFIGVAVILVLVLAFYYITKKREAALPENVLKIPSGYYRYPQPAPPSAVAAQFPVASSAPPAASSAPMVVPALKVQEKEIILETQIAPDEGDSEDTHFAKYEQSSRLTPILEDIDPETQNEVLESLSQSDYPYGD